MVLKEFTEIECEHYRKNCNFTPDELAVFNLRVKDVSIVAVCQTLGMSPSTVNKKISDLKKKIVRVM